MNGLKSKGSFIILLIMLLGTAGTALAQSDEISQMSTEEKAELLTEKHKERLNLSDEQEKSMYEINLKYLQEMEAITAQGRSMGTMKKLRDMSDRKDQEVKKVLDDAQYQEFQKMKAEARENMRERRASGRQ